ncbi:S8/S53 family peptidase [Cyanobacteria bacterium FACHB-DQ100]|nr:S8/S53 family peptidase [Cyanobacteria bacterium FACHB-DQ100]
MLRSSSSWSESSKSRCPAQPIDHSDSGTSSHLIGIIDTGFNANHPKIDNSRLLIGRDFIDGDNNPFVSPNESDHGTRVFDVITTVAESRSNSSDRSRTWLSRAVGSGQWAKSLNEFVDTAKATNSSHAVVNLSFDLAQTNPDGTQSTRHALTPQEHDALRYAHENGVLVVVASGNTGGTMSVLGQAAQEFDNIITVGAALGHNRAFYSSYGDGLSLVAYGSANNNSLLSIADNRFDAVEGTSIAAAEVTGTIANIWQANPSLQYHQVIDILESTATDLNTPGWDSETGAGLLNPSTAVDRAIKTSAIADLQFIANSYSTPISEGGYFNSVERPALFGVDLPSPGDIWDGIKDIGKGLKKGATWIAKQADSKLTGAFERTVDWVTKTPKKLKKLGSDYVELLEAVGTGDFEKAAKTAGRILIDYAEIAAIPELLETYYDWRKFNTRALTSEEIERAKSVFGNSINYDLVRIDEASFLVKARSFITNDAPFTSLNTINSWGGISPDTLIHELAHVWQYQHDGAVYIPEALVGQHDDRIPGTYPPGIGQPNQSGYDYGGATELVKRMNAGQSLFSFNREQQAEIVQHYYEIRTDGNLNNDIFLSLYANFVKQVSTLSEDQLGMLPTDSGNTVSNARSLDLSLLNGNTTLRESIGNFKLDLEFDLPLAGKKLGNIFNFNDEADLFRLNINSGNLDLTLSDITMDVDLQVIRDVDKNGVIDPSEIIAVSQLGSVANESISLTGLAPDEYLVKVFPFNLSDGRTQYTLAIST